MTETNEAEDAGPDGKADGTTKIVSDGERYIFFIDPANDLLRIDPDVLIEGDRTYGFHLTAPFTTADIRTSVSSRIICRDEGWTVDQHALLTRAHETGETEFRLTDFLVAT